MSNAATPEAPSLGLMARIVGVITSPGSTFADIVRAPRPAVVLLVVSAVIAVAAIVPQMTERGRQAILNTQVQAAERMTGQPVSDRIYAQLEQQSRSPFGKIMGVVSAFIMMPIVALFFAALFWAIFNALLGGTASFKQVLGISTHSMVIMALGAALAVPIQLMQTTISFSGPFNLGALVPMLDRESFLFRFLSFVNAITLWQTVVVAIGLGVLYKRKSTGIAIGLIVVYLALVAIGVTAFSALMGRVGS
jgi:hypothetical protein